MVVGVVVIVVVIGEGCNLHFVHGQGKHFIFRPVWPRFGS